MGILWIIKLLRLINLMGKLSDVYLLKLNLVALMSAGNGLAIKINVDMEEYDLMEKKYSHIDLYMLGLLVHFLLVFIKILRFLTIFVIINLVLILIIYG